MLPASAYHWVRTEGHHTSRCRACMAAASRARYRANPEKYKARHRERYRRRKLELTGEDVRD